MKPKNYYRRNGSSRWLLFYDKAIKGRRYEPFYSRLHNEWGVYDNQNKRIFHYSVSEWHAIRSAGHHNNR